MTSVVANIPEGAPIFNSLGLRKWKFASPAFTNKLSICICQIGS